MSAPSQLAGILSAYEAVKRMALPGGCAWHEAQTHESLTKFLIEECFELVDAIENTHSNAEPAEVASELGDVLYQVLFHAVIAERDGEGYDLDAVGHALTEKLIARHPHVFGDRGYMSEAELGAEWEHLKEAAEGAERGSRAPLEGIPAGMPTLAKAAKVVERLKRAKLLQPAGEPTTETELGEAMLRLVMQANAQGIDPDRALRLATGQLATSLMGE